MTETKVWMKLFDNNLKYQYFLSSYLYFGIIFVYFTVILKNSQ